MNRTREVRGTMCVKLQVQFRRPGPENDRSIWHKLVTIHTERGVTMDQATDILERWKEVNPDVVGEFGAALY